MGIKRLDVVRTWKELRSLRRSATGTLDEVQTIQMPRLRWMVDHAVRHVGLYRSLFPGDAARRLQHPDDLLRLPFTDRAVCRANPIAELLSSDPPPGSRRISSSGTTGEPSEVLYSPGAAWYQGILALRRDGVRGLRPWDKRCEVTSLREGPRRSGIWELLDRRFMRVPTTRPPALLARDVLALRPVLLAGHGHLLVELGEELDGAFRPRYLVTYGESLDGVTSDALVDLYGQRQLDQYGTAEHGSVAWQCTAADLYHIDHEAVLLEVLDDHGAPVPPGETGEVVLSGLWNPLMPFLRYRIGDIATLADRPCACGYRLPALARIWGRTMDWILDSRGRWVAPQRLWIDHHLERDLVQGVVRRYHVRQDATGAIRVLVLPYRDLPADFANRLQASYRRLLGQDAMIEVVPVADLPLHPSGKFRRFSSELVRSRDAWQSESPATPW
ncbi:MAG: phenylacetate--CoA ligase family protein [Chloroflexi bacterium]|nr:MAG: phenylacetate--CoA ligase family protein [Chloroflexota bacterium]